MKRKAISKSLSFDEMFYIVWIQYVDGEGILWGTGYFQVVNKIEQNKKTKKYYQEHKVQCSNHMKKYYENDKERQSGYDKEYYQKNREKIRLRSIRYAQTTKGKLLRRKVVRKRNSKRRELGFIELNQHFDGAQAHHIDMNRIIYIPKELHKSVSHNIWTGRNMEEINKKAFAFMVLQLFKNKKDENKNGKSNK